MNDCRNPACETGPSQGRWLHNMSAPPRSTVTFEPFGSKSKAAGGVASDKSLSGMHWRLRASPASLVRHLEPENAELIVRYREEFPHLAHKHDPRVGPMRIELRELCLGGLIRLSAHFLGETVEVRPGLPMEELVDRLADLAGRLPPPDLPAMGFVEPSFFREDKSLLPPADPLAGLWVLTHVNGRTFDRNGPAMIAPFMHEGAPFDLYVY